jgi:hypothetical protein
MEAQVTDIVQRLRDGGPTWGQEIFDTAADEIEETRKERDHYRKEAAALMKTLTIVRSRIYDDPKYADLRQFIDGAT